MEECFSLDFKLSDLFWQMFTIMVFFVLQVFFQCASSSCGDWAVEWAPVTSSSSVYSGAKRRGEEMAFTS